MSGKLAEKSRMNAYHETRRASFYHVSTELHVAGKLMGPFGVDDFNFFVGQPAAGEHHVETEAILEQNRPRGEQTPRNKAIYLFESIEQCSWYGDRQHKNDYFVYEVEAVTGRRLPMAIVDHIFRLYKNKGNGESISKAAYEYWNPGVKWRFFEFLCESCIVKSCTARNELSCDSQRYAITGMDYSLDLERCKSEFP